MCCRGHGTLQVAWPSGSHSCILEVERQRWDKLCEDSACQPSSIQLKKTLFDWSVSEALNQIADDFRYLQVVVLWLWAIFLLCQFVLETNFATVGLVTPSAFLSPHWQPWVTRRLQLLSSTTAVACARPALQVMMLLEQFSPPSWADQRCQELWLAWIRRIAMWETRHRASEVFWPWSIPLSTALSPIGMTWKLVCFMLNPLWVHDVS